MRPAYAGVPAKASAARSDDRQQSDRSGCQGTPFEARSAGELLLALKLRREIVAFPPQFRHNCRNNA
jgi:hypothetical protein